MSHVKRQPQREVNARRLSRWLLASLSFLIPTGGVVLYRTLGGQDGFSLNIFAAMVLAELALIALLETRHAGLYLKPGRRLLVRYLAHTVLGLPATIYLAIAGAVPELSVIRQGLVLLLLCLERFGWRAVLQHQALLLIGGLVFAWPLVRGLTGLRLNVLLLQHFGVGVAAVLGALLLSGWDRRSFVARLAAARAALLVAKLQAKLGEVAATQLPRRKQALLLGQAKSSAEYGTAVVALLGCQGVHAAIETYRQQSQESARAGIANFETEWTRLCEHLRRECHKLNYDLIQDADCFYAFRLLGDGEQQAPVERALIEVTLLAWNFVRFATRSERALAGRGQFGWTMPTIVSVGGLHGSLNGAVDWNWRLRGGAVLAAQRFLHVLGPQAPSRVWIAAEQYTFLEDLFERRDLLSEGSWVSPAFLRGELSVDGGGTDPLPSIVERYAVLKELESN